MTSSDIENGQASSSPRLIAFFLPQFHAIPENDKWWGEGFTEWTNTRKATRLFAGHHQPRTPAGSHYYDLTNAGELRRQSEDARRHGIDAFCFYFYWFDGRRLLERPVDLYTQLDGVAPFCLSWANENWTRRWDGKDSEVLMGQKYTNTTAVEVYEDLARYMRHPNYVRIDGCPVLVVHRVTDLPDPLRVAAEWRRLAQDDGLPGLYLVCAETVLELDPRSVGFDAVVEFPPVGRNTLRNALWRFPRGLHRGFRGRLLSYERLAQRSETRPEPEFVRHRGVMPDWDNTARRGSKATVYWGATPDRYRQWLRRALGAEGRARGERGLVFINAWNEWAEGAYLQPDDRHGNNFLLATLAAVRQAGEPDQPLQDTTTSGALFSFLPGRAGMHSILGAAGSSLLSRSRRAANRRLRP